MSERNVLAMFDNFDDAFDVLNGIKKHEVAGVDIDDVTFLSPIEHPDIDDVLEGRPVNIQKFTFAGALFGVTFGFLFLASAQASFLVQPQGGKPVIPLPTNFVLMYEMLIFFAVWTTVITFTVMAGLFKSRGNLYTERLTVDGVGILIEGLDENKLGPLKTYFKDNKAVEIREEKAK